MATGKYIQFVPPLIQSARTFFCTNHDVTYFVFTDQKAQLGDDVKIIYQKRLGWPFDTMHRFHTYLKNREQLEEMDYLFACDADMLFTDTVGNEILGDRVGTQHPGFVGKKGSYETNPLSTAYVHPQEGTCYFAGGFYGGKKTEFFTLLQTTIYNIDKDLEQDFIAVWHDESHLNRYFIDNPPTIILSPEYCHSDTIFDQRFKPHLVALTKKHEEYRN